MVTIMVSRVRIGLIVALALGGAACEKSQLVAPTESTVTITTASATVPLGGSTEVTAFVAESGGTPVQNGTTVRFSTNLGRVDPIEAQTKNGYAVATFSAGTVSGVAQVRATSGGAGGSSSETAGSPGSNVVEITVGGAATGTVAVTASPSSIPASGGTVTIIAIVLDDSGNRLANVPVTFSTDAGTLSSTLGTTDATGEARVQLTTTREAVVTARAGGQSGTVTVTVNTSIQITASPAAGTTATTFVFTVTPAQGVTPTDVTIDFGDGQTISLGAITSATAVPHQYSTSGSKVVQATQINSDGSTARAVVVVSVS